MRFDPKIHVIPLNCEYFQSSGNCVNKKDWYFVLDDEWELLQKILDIEQNHTWRYVVCAVAYLWWKTEVVRLLPVANVNSLYGKAVHNADAWLKLSMEKQP